MEQPVANDTAIGVETPLVRRSFFGRTERLSFAITAVAAFGIYLFTLAPEVTLDNSGLLATSAFYGGVGAPPGYPLWCVYGWLFTKLLPFSNIAWRVEVSSAVAAALTCGLIALMTSKGAELLLDGLRDHAELATKERKLLRAVAGYVAGMAFGFDTAFWQHVTVVDVWPLTHLLFAMVLCLMMKWHYAPERKGIFYAAVFCYGLLLCNSEAFAVAAPGLELMVVFACPALGRDLLLASALLIEGVDGLGKLGILPYCLEQLIHVYMMRWVYWWIGIFMGLVAVGLIAKTRAVFTNWKALLTCGLLLMLGLLPYFYLPLVSMTTPPVNFNYSRTTDGFLHLVCRGQYEEIMPSNIFGQFFPQMWIYGKSAIEHLGVVYLVLALVPFWFLRRMQASERRWMFGLIGLFFFLTVVWVAILNPSKDSESYNMYKEFFSPSHLIIAMWAGYGVAILGVILNRRKKLIADTERV